MTFRATLALTLLFASALLDAADEPPQQEVLLPMPDLLERLQLRVDGQDGAWGLVPAERYAALISAAREHAAPGAWVASAQLSAVIGDDDRLDVHAVLSIVASGEQPCRVPLFASRPDRLGGVRIDDGPAWLIARAGDGDGLDGIVAGAGNHRATLDWSCPLRDGGFSVPLPLSGALALRLSATGDGIIASDALKPRPGRQRNPRPRRSRRCA